MIVGQRLCVVACALALQGCAGALVENDWNDRPTYPSLAAHHFEVPAKDLPRICGNYPGMRLHGCAVRVVAEKICLIYTAPQPATWLMEHERKHCAGWDHGGSTGTRVAAVSPLSPGERHSRPHDSHHSH